MTNDLISREEALELARNHINRTIDCNDIARIPTVDAAPVVHGRWEDTIIGTIKCTLCGWCYNMYKGFAKYCPNCGAKMDKEAK